MLFTSKIPFGQYVLWDFNAHFAAYLPEFMLSEGELHLPWKMILYLSTGLISGIVVSLLTKPVAKEKLDNYYALIRTPIKPGEQVDKACTLPAGAVVPEKRNIFPNTNFEFMIPSRTSVVGFLIGWAFVAVIVVVVYMIASG